VTGHGDGHLGEGVGEGVLDLLLPLLAPTVNQEVGGEEAEQHEEGAEHNPDGSRVSADPQHRQQPAAGRDQRLGDQDLVDAPRGRAPGQHEPAFEHPDVSAGNDVPAPETGPPGLPERAGDRPALDRDLGDARLSPASNQDSDE